MSYEDPVVKKYVKLFQDNLHPKIKKIFAGDVVMVAKSHLPALIVGIDAMEVGTHSNAEDEHAISMAAVVVADVREDFSEIDTLYPPGRATVEEILIGRKDDGTYRLQTNTILQVLQNNLNVDQAQNLVTQIETTTNIEIGLRAGRTARIPEGWSVEGKLTWTAHFYQIR